MRAAGTRVHFTFDMPQRTEQGVGVISAEGDDGFLVLDDARFDNGNSAARVWIPFAKLRMLWANELPAEPLPNQPLREGDRVLAVGDLVLDRYGFAWVMFADGLLSSARFPGVALTPGDLARRHGPLTFHGHDDDGKAEL